MQSQKHNYIYIYIYIYNQLKSQVGILLLKFHLNRSSGSFALTNDKGENTIFYIHQKPTQLKIYIKEKNKQIKWTKKKRTKNLTFNI